ncbi:uncharacterized protein [Parasteatoda tepidariorum]|uniref:uncharacterized protein n=1 Tax=Parasteatoda tepidariorum TaxID=114398 RepID=UPI001C722D1F|nr:uncharacterized protein LOC107444938 [Parasteatoda tepidariorum]
MMKPTKKYGTRQRKSTSSISLSPKRYKKNGANQDSSELLSRPSTSTASDSPSTYFKSALNGYVKTIYLTNVNFLDIEEFLLSNQQTFNAEVTKKMQIQDLKVNCRLTGLYKKVTNDKIVREEKNFETKNTLILLSTDLEEFYSSIMSKLLTEAEDFKTRDSGWSLDEIIAFEIRFNKYNPLRASGFISLPPVINNKVAVVNVKNDDNECFKWAILSALHPPQANPNRISHYRPFANTLNFSNIPFPVKLQDVKEFEKLNDISINVYGLDEKNEVFPLILTEQKKPQHVDLLYLITETDFHFCWIKHLSRLLSPQYSRHNGRKYICRRCLQFFTTNDILTRHEVSCNQREAVRVKMPTDKWLKFKNVKHTQRVPFVIYADLESLLKPIDSCGPSPGASFTEKYQKHEPISFCYFVCGIDGLNKPPYVYRGRDAAKIFMEKMREEALIIYEKYNKPRPMKSLTKKQTHQYESATHCYVCDSEFSVKNRKVTDHCHVTRIFRGASCNKCNMQITVPNFIPVIFHNFSGYDSHLFIRELGKNGDNINAIAENTEKYISFSEYVSGKIYLRFIDSSRFMASSLDQLARNLTRNQFVNMKKFFSRPQVPLVLRKGVYPYDYIDHENKFKETTLPPPSAFHSKLNDCPISNEDYENAKKVWQTFKMSSLGEYSDLYVKTDALLLADVFENFRDVCMRHYNLDPAWYFTAPGLSWDAMLKKTKISIELLTDYDMILFIENGIRGGISQCSHRYGSANNKYMEAYDSSKPSNYLLYLDANNLYGWAMSQPLPLQDFKWVEPPTDVLSISDDGPLGFIFEVDLDYPKDLHDQHSDLPLAPETRIPPGCKDKRLLTTLYHKEKYVLHYRNLKFYLEQGLILKKVHRVLQFNQSPWLKNYIDLNTDLRTDAANEFEKSFFKLMNNAVFGKTLENIRKHVNIKLCSSEKKAEKLISRYNFRDRTILTEQLIAIHMRKTEITFNKPISIGMAVLDISKILMYKFHYTKMKTKYEEKIKLLYTDTDSFIYDITTEDVYSDMNEDLDSFDTSDYPEDNIYGTPRKNKKVLGVMKDENNGEIMIEFIGLRSKMYAFKVKEQVTKKLKGIKKATIEKRIEFEDYKKCLFENQELHTTMNTIQSKRHELTSVTINKLALSPYDHKRYVLDDKVSTVPFGHYLFPES